MVFRGAIVVTQEPGQPAEEHPVVIELGIQTTVGYFLQTPMLTHLTSMLGVRLLPVPVQGSILMAETAQTDIETGQKIPDVTKEIETKDTAVYLTRHLHLKTTDEAFEAFLEKLDKQIAKKKLHASDKGKMVKVWVQSRARLNSSSEPILDGTWDKETKQLYDELYGE